MESRSLNEKFQEEPYEFEFFQAVRLMERIYADRKSVGGDALPDQEIVRFRSKIGLEFPASEIQEIKRSVDQAGDERIEMIVNFMGMAGVSGVLPVHYTELVMDRNRHRDTTLWAFLDIFTHRAVSLFYRAWSKYRFPVAYERGNDDFTSFLFDFAGIGSKSLRGRLSVEDEALLPYSGLINQKPHSQNAIENIVGDQFSIRAKILQFFGQWLPLGKEDVTHLGLQNSALGESAIIGNRVWDQQSKFRVRLGPMGFKKFLAFLPNGSAHNALFSVLKFLVGFEFDFDTQFVLKAKEVPSTVLTTRAVRRPMLGWTTWLKTGPFGSDDDQVVLQSTI